MVNAAKVSLDLSLQYKPPQAGCFSDRALHVILRRKWARRSGTSADGALLLVLPAPGNQIHGRARGTGGASILFFLGTDLDAAQARRSWELVHELVHLGFPSLPRRNHWAEEGLATYVEPIARARAGELSAEKVWGDLVRGLPQGLPGRGDEGLDRTHTWGRTYWGGALIWLLADVEIRERTGNRLGLEDALRAVLAQGGSIAERWPLQRALEVGDRAVGTRVLEELYAKMGSAPMKVDLDALFLRLGVELRRGVVELDDRAPLAPLPWLGRPVRTCLYPSKIRRQLRAARRRSCGTRPR